MYQEIDVEVYGYQGVLEMTTINIANISYFRPFTETPIETGKESCLVCMVFMNGSVKGIKVKCSSDELKAKIKKAKEEN